MHAPAWSLPHHSPFRRLSASAPSLRGCSLTRSGLGCAILGRDNSTTVTTTTVTPMATTGQAQVGPARALHWVFKVGDRTASTAFYRDVLGMEALRHEEVRTMPAPWVTDVYMCAQAGEAIRAVRSRMQFTEGCAAACNGPYDGRWSKTMIGVRSGACNWHLQPAHHWVRWMHHAPGGSSHVMRVHFGGSLLPDSVAASQPLLQWSHLELARTCVLYAQYGDEDHHFVLELTYNYGVKSYQLGNDYDSITVCSKRIYDRVVAKGVGKPTQQQVAAAHAGQQQQQQQAVVVEAPDGYRFNVVDADVAGPCPVTQICLHVEDIKRSLAFWSAFLGFSATQPSPTEALITPGAGQCSLKLVQLPDGTKLDRGTAFGRIAFACPGGQLQQLEADVRAAGYTVHTPYISLDTPGKATVQVVILQDPDGHEICFVGDEGFRDLSRVDPDAPRLLDEAVAADGSADWFKKRAEQESKWAAKGL